MLAQLEPQTLTQGGFAGVIISAVISLKWLFHDSPNDKHARNHSERQTELLEDIKESCTTTANKIETLSQVAEVRRETSEKENERRHNELLESVKHACKHIND